MKYNFNGFILKDKYDVDNFINGIKLAWTYGKFTESEKKACISTLKRCKTITSAEASWNKFLRKLEYNPTVWGDRFYTREDKS